MKIKIPLLLLLWPLENSHIHVLFLFPYKDGNPMEIPLLTPYGILK